MKSRKNGSSPRSGLRKKGKPSRGTGSTPKEVASIQQSRRLTAHQQDEKVRGLAAINRFRRGDARSLSSAARAEGTTVDAIRALFPEAITQDQPGGRLGVTLSDRYSADVQVLTTEGALSITARGSRERELAGRHRATVIRVLRGQEPRSALEQYRGKTVGGHELISDFDLLSTFAQAGVVGQLDSLYVSPDAIG